MEVELGKSAAMINSGRLFHVQGLQWFYSTQDGVIVADKWFLLLINFASRTVL
jgi:hypothetical protein